MRNLNSAAGERACYFDDVYRFEEDGSFVNVMGDSTWLEPWQGVAEEQCGPPVAPHDGSRSATYTFDKVERKLVTQGQGSFIGLSKVHNTGEDGAPVDNTITYDVSELTDSYLLVDIGVAGGVWWRFGLQKM